VEENKYEKLSPKLLKIGKGNNDLDVM